MTTRYAIDAPSVALRIVTFLGDKFRWRMFAKVQAKRTQYLQVGDVVEARIRTDDGAIDLGVQRNRIVDEPA